MTSPKCVEALRAALSPVKREESFFSDAARPDEDQRHGSTASQSGVLHTTQTKAHQPGAVVTSVGVDKLSGGGTVVTGLSSAGDKHAQQWQCVYCAQSFKSKGELERHVKSTHVMPTTSQKCNICDEVFPSAAVLAEHKLTHCKVNTWRRQHLSTVCLKNTRNIFIYIRDKLQSF